MPSVTGQLCSDAFGMFGWWVLVAFAGVGLVCMCCDWDWMDLGCCSATVCLLLLLFVVPQGVMVGKSGESWRHKSTLSPIPSSQGWAY